jgi:hypothetical protein
MTATVLPVCASDHDYDDDDYYYGDDYYYEYGDEYSYDVNGDSVAAAFFWVLFVLIGIFVPIGLIVLGCILPNVKKLGRPKYWYALTVSGGVWLLTALFITLMLLIV